MSGDSSHHCPSPMGVRPALPESLVQASSEGTNSRCQSVSVRTETVKYSNSWEVNPFINQVFSIPAVYKMRQNPKALSADTLL